MKIAFVIPCNTIAGGLFVVYRHAHYLQSVGHDVRIVITDGSLGSQITWYPNFSVPVSLLTDEVAHPVEYDAVLATWWETYYDMFHLNAKTYLYFCQSDERRFYDKTPDSPALLVERTYCDPRVRVITEAKWIQRMFQHEFGVEAGYAPNGVDLTRFHLNVQPLVPRGPRVRVLVEGPGGASFKRVDLAFRVTARVPDIEVWFVCGDGVVQSDWKADRVFKKVRFEDMPPIYASCDILIKLSTVEGVFGPPLEMFACGGTAVVSNVSGYDEYIVDEHNALVVPMDDEDAALQALSRLVSDADLRKRLSAAGQKTALAWDWNQQTPIFERVLSEFAGRPIPMPRAARVDYLLLNRLRRLEATVAQYDPLQVAVARSRPVRAWNVAKHEAHKLWHGTRSQLGEARRYLTHVRKRLQPDPPGCKKGMVSVIIPIYDRTDILRASIRSILAQTYSSFEVLLITDGSPRETIAVVEEFRSDPRVRIFHFPDNSGNAVRGRNKGIQEAQGEFIAFHDSDDLAAPNRLELSVDTLRRFDVDAVHGSWRALLDGSRTIKGLRDGQVVRAEDFGINQLLRANYVCQSTVTVRRAALLDVGGVKPQMRYREDHELWLRLMHNGYFFKAIPEVLTNLRLHSGNNELNFKEQDPNWEQLMLKEYRRNQPSIPV
jgi:glycosyltransferase involved in cell wall biosynthesis